ncbi:hemerythrin domain-containing protein [Blastococcus brunescens]|uniref:Hemerythrin domain-containing protein n=1 Tax=Blastococcus brunescens TaxID=1564165 RepID=A0ABZ1B0W2_9ACTN|nr:hemerythrin domain-containing protein [Blastococcus sp. BMG 8361]WRL62974.1 hemerythrin domain-containing protein [Blastococcus sp. BMG 8361]
MTTFPTTDTDTRDMVVVHDSIRRQFGEAPALVRGVTDGDTARAAVVADHLDLLGDLLHHHHTGEDRLLWPVLGPRVPTEVAETVQRMESQHDGIAEAQGTVTAAAAGWRLTAATEARETLAAAVEELTGRITEHLAAEEEHILPLAAAHLTPAEWQRLGEEGIGGLPRKQLPLVFGMVMYRADPVVIRGMLSHAPLGPRLLMPHLAPRVYARYARRLHGTATGVSNRPWRTSGSVERVVPAGPLDVYAVVSDVTRIGERSPECHTAAWLPGAADGTVGAVFRGSNHSGWAARWSRRCEVVSAETGRAFAFRTLPERIDLSRRDSTTWRYDLEPVDGGTRVVHSYEITRLPVRPMRALYGALLPHHRDMRPQMQANLDALHDQFAPHPVP